MAISRRGPALFSVGLLTLAGTGSGFLARPAAFGRGFMASATRLAAAPGDVVTVDWSVKQASGGALPESLQVFDQGTVRFVVGAGNLLPCLHAAVQKMDVGEKLVGAEIAPADAFGESNPELGPIELPRDAAPAGLEVGNIVQLSTGQRARVTVVTDDVVAIDTNSPMAGVTLSLDAELVACQSPAEAGVLVAHFALGCFWGAELAFQREPGVLATKVGYTQGEKEEPTYQEVCSGATGHTEAVQVVYDPAEVTYERLLELFWDRLGDNRFLLNQVGNDRGTQYRHGIYPHSPEQKAAAEASLMEQPRADAVQTEIRDAAKFWDAEDYHQQYLQKGGQSAKKEASETIRCYG